MQACAKALIFTLLLFIGSAAWAGDAIPKAAWKRPIGEPLQNAGTKKPELQEMIDDGYWQGAPVGGLGAGTFSQSYRGDFVRWHLKTGVHKYQPVYSNAFAMYQKAEGGAAVAQVLAATHPQGQLTSWKWDYPVGAGDYYALYPKSWFDYRAQQFPAHVYVEQFSPILPNNYKESSYPVAVYRWHAENPTNTAVTVSILFSWTNMIGWFRDFTPQFEQRLELGNTNRFQTASIAGGRMAGIVFDRSRKTPVRDDWDGQFAIAALESPGVEITHVTTYVPFSDGSEIWKPFSETGSLPKTDQAWVSSGETLAGAIAVKFTLRPGEKRTVPVVLAWDLPYTEFGSGRKWLKRYTDFYGTSGTNAWAIARNGLEQARAWSDAIDAWQAPYINDESKPLWYRGMLFNELYILADGGTLWGRPVDSAANGPRTFAFLECFDYPFYGTLDVRFYGSAPLAKFWPDIDKQVLRQFADTVTQEDPRTFLWDWATQQEHKLQFRVRKAKGAVPHDLGVPKEDPIMQPNQFSWQNTNRWKDLNSKFVLMVWRDFVFSGTNDVAFLKYCWPASKMALEYLKQFDHDGDGLPDGEGFPDQTYDVWIVRGDSAYADGLYLAAVRAAEEMARRLNDSSAATYHTMFTSGQKAYIDKLWNGSYFRYDTGSEYKDNVQADQLAGQWYATMTGLGDIVPKQMRVSALHKIFDLNVMRFNNGEMGAVNGMGADGQLITTNEQVHEVWVGTTFGLAALMLQDGLRDEAYKTASGIYNVVYQTKGYWFRTPEAWDERGLFRASMYMRPAAVWAMEMLTPATK
jgi:non-lysosomal glucosylceramidase